jgi:hypothetical protein
LVFGLPTNLYRFGKRNNMLERTAFLASQHLRVASGEGDPQVIVGQLILSCAGSLAVYLAVLAGLELGGRINGYPGRGKEVHEDLMRQLKDAFTRHRRR